MSGVYIPGMKMPYDCPACPAAHWNAASCFTGCEIVPGKRYAMADPDYAFSSEPPDWCPLVPVPDHGRLIDADALGIRDEEKRAYEAYQMEKHEYFIEEPLLEYKRGLSEGLIRASGLVRFAPTIIPASKEGER